MAKLIKLLKLLFFEAYKEVRYAALPKPRPILFDHLPKCGGSTINRYLKSNFPRRLTYEIKMSDPKRDTAHFLSLPEKKRHRYQLILGHRAHDLLAASSPERFTMTVLREPIDRVISHYYFVRESPSHRLYKQAMETPLTEYPQIEGTNEVSNWYTFHFLEPIGLQELRHKPMGVEKALAFIGEQYHLVGFQDDIDGCILQAKETCNLPEAYQSSYVNQTTKRKAVEELTEEERGALEAGNASDVALFQALRADKAGSE